MVPKCNTPCTASWHLLYLLREAKTFEQEHLAVENVFQLPALHDANPIIFMTGIRIKHGRFTSGGLKTQQEAWLRAVVLF